MWAKIDPNWGHDNLSFLLYRNVWKPTSFDAVAALTSSKLLKHQVEFVFLLKELHQFQDVTVERVKSEPEGTQVCCTEELPSCLTTLPVALALIEHLNLSKDTAATVARSFLNDLET